MFNKLKILKKMKIKNLKLMLLGLIGLMSTSNVFAAYEPFDFLPEVGQKKTKDGVTYQIKAETDIVKDETGRSVNNIVYDLYTIKWTAVTGTANFTTKEAFVLGVNGSAADADVATLAIPATVTGDKGEYDVVEVASDWKAAEGMKDVTTLTKTLSVDITNFKTEPVDPEADPIVMKTGQTLAAKVYGLFTKLESLTITDTYAATATAPARYTVFAGGFGDAAATLKTASLEGSNITTIGNGAFGLCTALTGFDFGTKITSIGAEAFSGCYGISELTIPATVTEIGEDAFANMYKAKEGETPAKGLKTLIINGANNEYDGGNLVSSKIPAAFKGNGLLESVTIGSTTATEIEASAFAKDEVDYDPAIKVIDLSGATALETIGEGAFPASCPLETVKLAGTKLTDAEPAVKKICTIDLSAAQKTLATLTFPAGYTTLAESQFRDFVALTKVDLSNTKVKAIPNYAFFISGDVKGDDGKAIAPALAEVKLNEETTSVGNNAFNGQSALATVTGLNQEKLAEIGINAFNGTALTTLELDKTKLTGIKKYSFGNIATLTSIKLPATVTAISTAAFANDAKVASINLQDTKITVLNPIFHEGVVDGSMEGYETTDKEVAIALTSVTLPDGLIKIAPGALQLLDITDIVIPATVEAILPYALQGCIKLSTFTWNDAQSRTIYDNAFRGDDHLTEVKMVTKTEGATIEIVQTGDCSDTSIDVIFKGNKKDVLKFIVNAEDRASLEAQGWSESNLHYCTLTSTGASKFTFNEKAKTGEYYYATYYNDEQATWFPEENFEVFGAVVEGSEVVLTPATVEGGYYKVESFEACVIRSKSKEAEIELKNAEFNDISTLPTDNDLVYGEDVTPSRLNFTYKLGIKNGVVAFYRITSGKINGVYIMAQTPSDRLDIVVKGEEATAIKGINAAEKKGAIYNLNGMRVNKAGKGVYIQDGKKYVVK
jgi:hypothetical protein